MNTDATLPSIHPFPSPLDSFSTSTVSTHGIVSVVFLIAFVIWVLYTLIAGYHWFRYGHQSWLAVPALGVHIFVSGVLVLYIMSGLF